MRKLLNTFFFTFCLLCLFNPSWAQVPVTFKQGPAGIFLFAGSEVPSGKIVTSYKIERSSDNVNWKQIAELKTPADFAAFAKAVERSKSFFPSQPLPPMDKLKQVYQKAVATGSTDSLKGVRLQLPVRMALGTIYYDTSAKKHITYQYRVDAMKPSGGMLQRSLTDTVSLPFQVKFDSIVYSESSYNTKNLLIRWKSAGKHPAPLFMVFRFRNGAPVPAYGNTSIYTVNDTTFFSYYDTTVSKDAGKEMQYFVSPFDHFGNSGLSSQVAVITQDGFNKAVFVKGHTAFSPLLSGIQVCWHYTDPVTVKMFEIYRSETPTAGFGKLAVIAPSDTSYLDQQIWPEKTYYYYVQSVAKAGKRTKQSEVTMARVPGIVINEKPKTPTLRQVLSVNGQIRLVVEINDTTATHIRIFRGVKDGLVAMPGLVETKKAPFVLITDSTLSKGNEKDIFYAVRNENVVSGISGLSDELPVVHIENADEVTYFYASALKGKIELCWDDVVGRNNEYSSYTLARQVGAANSKSPLMILAEHLTGSRFTDDKAESGNQYTYVLSLVDKAGSGVGKSYKITTSATR